MIILKHSYQFLILPVGIFTCREKQITDFIRSGFTVQNLSLNWTMDVIEYEICVTEGWDHGFFQNKLSSIYEK